ncbi:MAG: isoprenylcysteine carboxylmethyltransferase family protein [Synergistaceae bacterium]|nr:isoprenylcysteine carboxylmethyltransferase family protein [Synergistaceae bacterium]
MPVNKKISSIAFKCRGLFWALFAASALVFPSFFGWERFTVGLVIVISGQLIRFWAAGYIPKYRTEKIGAPILVTWGPYKWIRNPLYAGNFVMGLGWSLMLGWIWVTAFTLAFLLLYCCIVMPAEEEFLASKFGPQYLSYRDKVPSLFPYPRNGFPDEQSACQQFDRTRAWAEEIYSIRINLLITVMVSAKLYISCL